MPYTVMSNISDEVALGHVARYFGMSGGAPYTGSAFETLGRRGDTDTANVLTADDLIAVSMLAVHVPGKAALALLQDKAGEISDLPAEIDPNWRLEDLNVETVTGLEAKSAAKQLWSLLRQRDGQRWGIGPTTASKIMARKRPHLIPVYDSVVAKTVGLASSRGQWTQWHEALRKENGALVERLRTLHRRSEQHHLSLLRLLDIIIWMHGKAASAKIEMAPDREQRQHGTTRIENNLSRIDSTP